MRLFIPTHLIYASSNEYCRLIHQIKALVRIFLLRVVSYSGIFKATFGFKGPVHVTYYLVFWLFFCFINKVVELVDGGFVINGVTPSIFHIWPFPLGTVGTLGD